MRTFVFTAFVVAGLGGLVAAQSGNNVLIVVADDLGVDHVRVYGEGTTTPATTNLDALAGRGVLFRNAWAYPTCSPTRAALNTGRHPFRTGVGSPGAQLATNEFTVPEVLDAQSSGYAHAWIGKWHLGSNRATAHPTDAGWSHFTGLLGGGVPDYYRWPRVANGVSSISTTYSTTQIVDDALAWIQQQQTPWLCVVAFNAPHTPYHSPPAHLHSQVLAGLDPSTTPFPFYQAAVEAMDAEIGRLFATLGTVMDSTNVVFLGDNGTPRQVSRAPFSPRHAKGTAYEGGAGVPFIVAGPVVVGGGREVSALVSAVDLPAAIGALAGVDHRTPLVMSDSVSFVPYLTDPAQAPLRAALYTESFSNGANPSTDGFAAARDSSYKLIQRLAPTGVTEEVYDLVQDPFETRNLVSLGLGAAAQSARDRLAAHIAAVRDTTGRFESYGSTACAGTGGIPQLVGTGTPRAGGSYGLTLTRGAAGQPALFAIGAFDDVFLGLPLPFDLARIGGGPGCLLWSSAEAHLVVPTDAAGSASVSVVIPALAVAVGGAVHHTALVVDPFAQQNPAGLTATAGVRAILGR